MTKLDFRKSDRALYAGKSGEWSRLAVPAMTFLMIDGQGNPNGPAYAAALQALYPLAYGVKFAMKARGADFTVPPLEALWWADDMSAFVAGDRAAWRWTAMLRVPETVTTALLETVLAATIAKQTKKKDGASPDLLRAVRLATLTEGDCLQTLHLGPYSAEAPVLADLHHNVMPGMGLTFGGQHHEIYLSDPRRVAPDKLKTLLRQPVRPA
jgi:hypothetical protein